MLYLGYFNTRKGINDLIAAVGQLPDPTIRLVIAGTGPEELHLKTLAASDKRISFMGYTDGKRKGELMSWADVFVLPTLSDCWGLVINESLHYGTPVITTTSAGASQLIEEDVNGLRVAPHDPNALASALEYVLTNTNVLNKLTRGAKAGSADITDSRVGARPIIEAIFTAAEAK